MAALRAIEGKNENVATGIARDFQGESNVEVRIAALEAIARVGTFEANADALFSTTLSNNEYNPVVRAAAQRPVRNTGAVRHRSPKPQGLVAAIARSIGSHPRAESPGAAAVRGTCQ